MNSIKQGKLNEYPEMADCRDFDLYHLYWIDGKSASQIAGLRNVSKGTILNQMMRTGIPRRTVSASLTGNFHPLHGITGKDCKAWRGGRRKHSSGYILVKQENHPHCNAEGYIYEHRLMAEKFLGRPLTDSETCHHRDGVRDFNESDNLWVFADSPQHLAYERWMRVNANPQIPNAVEATE